MSVINSNIPLKSGNVRSLIGKRPMNAVWLAGYRDASSGLPFRKEYELWLLKDQQNYELGRLVACNMLSCKIKSPPLRVHRTKAYVAAYERSNEQVGKAHDTTRQPSDAEPVAEQIQVY